MEYNEQSMEIKLIALDLDGTFLDSKGRIPAENRAVIAECARRGVIIALSSGRMTVCITPFADALGIDCPVISYNGAMVCARVAEDRRMIFHDPLPVEHGDRIISYCREERFFLNVYVNDILHADNNPEFARYAKIYADQTGAIYRLVDDIRTVMGNASTKLILITDVENRDRKRTRDFQYEYFSGLFGGAVTLFKTNPEYLEFLKQGVDKGVGLERLAAFYGIPREKIVAFGDGENDIAMLRYAGTGVAVANAGESVKKSADVVLAWTNDEAAVGKYLSKMI